MENKKFDIKQILAFVLLSILLGAFFYLNKPDPSQQDTKKQTTEKKQKIDKNTAERVTDSIMALTQPEKSGEQLITLENDLLKIKISTLGGQLKEVLLKKEYAYEKQSKNHHKPLYLINGNANLSFHYHENGKLASTGNLVFSPTQQGNKLILTANTNKGKIQYIYTLGDKYALGFAVKSQGLQVPSVDSKVPISFDLKAFSLEKGRKQEEYYNSSVYRIKEDEDVDTGPLFGDDWSEKEALDWVAFKQQFFTSVLQNDKGFVDSNMEIDNVENDSTYIKNYAFSSHVLAENGELNQEMKWTFAPLKLKLLKTMGNDYSEIIPFGWGIIGWLNKFVFYPIFMFFANMGLNFGIVILLMTVVVKLLLSPIQYKQFKQSAMMRVLKPDIDQINEKYKDKKEDAVKKQQEVMSLYSRAGANPLSGCIPALIQVPIFYALFRFFPNIFELRGKPFLWAEDLTTYDSIIEWTENIPIITSLYGNHVSLFALLYMVLLLIYTKMTSGNLTQPTQEGMPDMRFLMYLMPIMFVFFLNSYASGLSWYYVVSNIINIGLILIIKNFLIDEEKIHALVQQNKSKPKKESKLQKKMREMMDQAQEQQKRSNKK